MKTTKQLSLSFVSLFLLVSTAEAWTAPTANPYTDTRPAPINTSITSQTKDGGLGIGGTLISNLIKAYTDICSGINGSGVCNGTVIKNTGVQFPDGTLQTTAFVTSTSSSNWTLGGSGLYYNGLNVGIGTAAPIEELHLRKDQAGATRLLVDNLGPVGATTIQSLALGENGSIGAEFRRFRDGSGKAEIGNLGAAPFAFFTNNIERARIDGSGNFGIGTNSPSGKLSVMDTVSGLATGLVFSGHHNPGVSAGGVINSQDTNGTVRQLILQSNGGAVGIGTNTPTAKLAVNATGLIGGANQSAYDIGAGMIAAGKSIYSYDRICAGNAQGDCYGEGGFVAGPNGVRIQNNNPTVTLQDTDGSSAFLHTNSNFFYVLRGGVNANTWTPINGTWPFSLDLTTNAAYFGGTVYMPGGMTDTAGPRMDAGGGWFRTYGNTGWYNGTYAGGMYMIDTTWIRTYAGKYLYVDSIIQAGAYMNSPAYYYISDIRLKKDLKKIDSPLENLVKLNGYNFTWKKDDKKDMGLIAQEVEKVFPNLVSEYTDPDSKEKYKNVEYGHLVAPIVESIKELFSNSKKQEERIKNLEEENKILKQDIQNIKKMLNK
jgi:hypothetical protein